MKLKYILKSMRVHHWVKNVFIFFPALFSTNLIGLYLFINLIIAFLLFSFASSAVYLLNDVIDFNSDRFHPNKKKRPIAAGLITKKTAVSVSLFLGLLSIYFSYYFLGKIITEIIVIYLFQNVLYSYFLKNIVILDSFLVAIGFMLRMLVGSELLTSEPSHWIILMTLFLALFISFGKRRAELISIKDGTKVHRTVLTQYSVELINQILSSLTSIIILYYTFYTFSDSATRFSNYFPYTVPIVAFGCFRYLYLMNIKKLGEDPIDLLFKDMGLFISVVIWLIAVIIMIYR